MEPRLEIVIPSRHRTGLIQKAVRFFPDPLVCVDALEEAAYRAAIPGCRLVTHPSSVNTLQKIRQWILDHVEADVVFQADDDLEGIYCMMGHHPRQLTAPEDIEQVIWNAALNCRDAGTIMFFFNQVNNPVSVLSFKPFVFVAMPVGCAMGFWREAFNREIRFDPTIQHAGLDAMLRILVTYRIIWCDKRFCFQPGPHMTAPGGLAGLRTRDGIDQDDAVLMRRYGPALQINHDKRVKGRGGKMSGHIHIRVER